MLKQHSLKIVEKQRLPQEPIRCISPKKPIIAGKKDNMSELEEALAALNMAYEVAPREAIHLVLQQAPHPIISERIRQAVSGAYDDRFYEKYDATMMTPVWLSIAAEKHLDPQLIRPAIKLVAEEIEDVDEFFSQMAMVLVFQLAKAYPEEVFPLILATINRCIDRRIRCPYYLLFPALRNAPDEKYKNEILKILYREAKPFFIKYLSALIHFKWPEVISFAQHILDREKDRNNPLYERPEQNEIRYALEAMEGKRDYDYGFDLCTASAEERINYWEHTLSLFDQEEEEAAEKKADKVIQKPKIERNDPCPCGSGKKFKKCHAGTGVYD